MSGSDVELVRQSFVRWGETGEPDWSVVHEEVEVHDHDILDAGTYRGREGIVRWLEEWGLAWSEFSMDPEEFIDAGRHVVVVLRMTAKGRGSSATVERQDAIVYELRDEKIVRLDYYNNREQALEAVGLQAP